MAKQKGVTQIDAPKAKTRTKASSNEAKSVRVWSEVGVTIAISDDPPQFLRFTFGHERLAKSDSQEQIKRTAALVDEFNEAEVERRIKKYTRTILRAMSEDDEDERPSKKKGNVRDRAMKRLDKSGYS